MQYMGSKTRGIGPNIAKLLNSVIKSRSLHTYSEPFCGALSVLHKVRAQEVRGSDACVPLITTINAIRKGWDPPLDVDKSTWTKLKKTLDPADPMTAFVGFGCSWAGNYFGSFIGTYKFTKRRVPAATAARSSLLRKIRACAPGAAFTAGDYTQSPHTDIVYCDPPYLGTSGYTAVGAFNHAEFWDWCRARSTTALVGVSELSAPDDFVAVLSKSIQQRMCTRAGSRRSESLYVHKSQVDAWQRACTLRKSR